MPKLNKLPFTPTHILAVVPIAYCIRALSLSGMAIGSMIPDLPLFYPVGSYGYTHSPSGVFLFCIPAGLFVYLLFQLCVKQFLIDLSPDWFRLRLQCFREALYPSSVVSMAVLCVSIYLGAATHAIWDSFTYDGRWGTEQFPGLLNTSNWFVLNLPWYKVIQYGSSLVGLPLLVCIAYWDVRSRTPAEQLLKSKMSLGFKLSFIVAIALVPVVIMLLNNGLINNLNGFVGAVLKQSIAIGTIIVLLFSALHAMLSWKTV